MTFIEEITPYIDRIKLHHNGGRITNLEVLRAIRDIHFQYIRRYDFNTPANLGCNNCVRQMINQLIGKIERDSCIGKKMTFPKVEKLEVSKEYDTIPKRWGQFKKYCTSKGLTVKGKTRKELENELKGL
jgi:hypothetical protein